MVTRAKCRSDGLSTSLIFEYDGRQGNAWVPHPISFAAWTALAVQVGLTEPRLLARVPSRYLGSIYSALSLAP